MDNLPAHKTAPVRAAIAAAGAQLFPAAALLARHVRAARQTALTAGRTGQDSR
jgi:hypothetical protein